VIVEFEIPESLDGLTADEVRALREKAHEAGIALASKSDDETTTEDLDKMDALQAFLADADAKVDALEAEDAERVERLARARGAFEPKAEEPAEEEAPAEEAKAEEKEPVLASAGAPAKRNIAGRLQGKTPVEEAKVEKPRATLTASGDIPGYSVGQKFEGLDGLADAATALFGVMPSTRPMTVAPMRHFGLAKVKKGRTDGLTLENSEFRSLQEVIEAASKESRLPGGSLTAAGGWCAPSETVYDLCEGETLEGLWDVPEVGVNRGGLSFTKGPDFSDIYDLGGFLQTEAQAEAGTEKNCWNVECPEFEDVRLDAIGICITAGILTNAAYPELVRRYISGALTALQHRISGNLIQRALTITGAATTIANGFPSMLTALTAIELVIEGERQRYRLGLNQTLEVVLPFWVRSAIRADFANRTGVEMTNVTNEMINAHFTNRGARVQFVYNWQDLAIRTGAGTEGDPYVNVPATNWPTNVEALIYPAGTFTRLSQDLIRLDNVYDSTNIRTNSFTGIFAEEGIALANTCWEARRLSIPVTVSGLTGAANINQDYGSAGPLNQVPIIEVTSA
jgi:hypothetical protein